MKIKMKVTAKIKNLKNNIVGYFSKEPKSKTDIDILNLNAFEDQVVVGERYTNYILINKGYDTNNATFVLKNKSLDYVFNIYCYIYKYGYGTASGFKGTTITFRNLYGITFKTLQLPFIEESEQSNGKLLKITVNKSVDDITMEYIGDIDFIKTPS